MGRNKMEQNQIMVQRLSLISSRLLQDVVASLDEAMGHPNMSIIRNEVTSAQSCAELGTVVQKTTGGSAFMDFARYDPGEILRKKRGEQVPGSLCFVVGNPGLTAQMAEHLRDAASRAPVTILADERPDGVPMTCDTKARFLPRHGSPEGGRGLGFQDRDPVEDRPTLRYGPTHLLAQLHDATIRQKRILAATCRMRAAPAPPMKPNPPS